MRHNARFDFGKEGYIPLECWFGENGKLAGTDDVMQMNITPEAPYYLIPGKSAKYIVFANDKRVTFRIALTFAIFYHNGAFVRYSLDLRTI